MVAQAMGGGMSITGAIGGEPTRAGIPIGDLGGGLMGVIGVLGAIVARSTTNRGQHVDISMHDAQISLLNYMATMHFLSGEIPDKLGNAHFVHVPYNTFPTQDGYIIIAVITDGFWENLMSLLNLPELDIPENKGQPGRWKNQEQINACLRDVFQSNTQAYWIEQLSAARIPCAPVYNLQQALHDEQVVARNMVVEVAHPSGKVFSTTGNPIKMSDTYEDSYTPPPLLGQHTGEILKSLLCKSDAELAELREKGIIA
jgi:crotonobetainyl-CoA:carnitine CoA-transferase CaiB-like acyl-CoA transferase